MDTLETLTQQVMGGHKVTKEEALWLSTQPLEPLCRQADMIRRHFCKNTFDLCTIINGKSGRCSENCKFCAQSAHNHTGADTYPLLSKEVILADAKKQAAQGVLRYSIVTAGKALSDKEIDNMCDTIRQIRQETTLSVCVSFGLLTEPQFRRLKEAGVSRVHNNLETSEKHFPNICTTHTFADKVSAIQAAQRAGLTVCSGGIMGMGETMADRIDMALSLRELGITSVPVNVDSCPLPFPFACRFHPYGWRTWSFTGRRKKLFPFRRKRRHHRRYAHHRRHYGTNRFTNAHRTWIRGETR